MSTLRAIFLSSSLDYNRMMDPGQKVLSDGFILKYTSAGLRVISSRCNSVPHATGLKCGSESDSEIRATKRKREARQTLGLKRNIRGIYYATLHFLILLRLRVYLHKVTWVFKLFALL